MDEDKGYSSQKSVVDHTRKARCSEKGGLTLAFAGLNEPSEIGRGGDQHGGGDVQAMFLWVGGWQGFVFVHGGVCWRGRRQRQGLFKAQ